MDHIKGRYWIQGHQNKEAAFQQAMYLAGYKRVINLDTMINVALFNLDSGPGGKGWDPKVEWCAQQRIPMFLFPHSARPMVQYDGIIKVHPKFRAMFVISEGAKKVMESFDFPIPCIPVGWPYSQIKPFEPCEDPKNILFAPIHPNNNGYLSPVDKDLNFKTFTRVHEFCQKAGLKLKVRYLRNFDDNGIGPYHPDVEYIHGKPDGSTVDIEQSDIIIGHQTFAYISVALGKPTLMMGEKETPRSGNSDTVLSEVRSWNKYKDLLKFPLDILGTKKIETILEEACTSDSKIKKWKELFIGEPFDDNKFIKEMKAKL